MKKLFILFSIIGIFILSSFSAESPRIVSETQFLKTGGSKNIWGQVRYDYVSKVVDYIESETGDFIVRRVTVTCEGGGDEKCSKKLTTCPTEVIQLYDNNSIYAEILVDIEDELLLEIDIMLVDEGSTSGSISRTYVLTSIEGNTVYLHHIVSWDNGNENGDANIRIQVVDMTNQM